MDAISFLDREMEERACLRRVGWWNRAQYEFVGFGSSTEDVDEEWWRA
jgi:hypothetical protein